MIKNTVSYAVAQFEQALTATYLTMLDDRNLSSHVYDEQTVWQIFGRIQQRYVDSMVALLSGLKAQLQ